MAIVVQQSAVTSPSSDSTTTVQNIIDATSQDLRKQIATTGEGGTALIDYVNRISLAILRFSRWRFLLSPPKRFITELHQTAYWIGPSADVPNNVQDTGLNLSDIQSIKRGSVLDRSNFRLLSETTEPPFLSSLSERDASSRPGKPRLWRNAVDTPNILNVYPAPDNQNTYQPVPAAPVLSSTAGGALAQRTYFVKLTLVDTLGNESTTSNAARQVIAANNLVVVAPPDPTFQKGTSGVLYDRYNVYASTTEGSETKQNTSPVAITATWTEPASGLVVGANPPTTNTLEPLRGYVIEFRYYKIRQQLTAAGQILQIPDQYKDIVVAGVNWLAALYLGLDATARDWKERFYGGLVELIHDKNLFPRGSEFVRPDPRSAPYALPSIETLDEAVLLLS